MEKNTLAKYKEKSLKVNAMTDAEIVKAAKEVLNKKSKNSEKMTELRAILDKKTSRGSRKQQRGSKSRKNS